MELSRDDVTQIAKLARLRLSDDQVVHYQAQLSGVLEYIKQLDTVDTANVVATSQVTGLTNVLADDAVQAGPGTPKLLQNVPQTEDSSIKVRAVFDRDGGTA